MLWRTKIDTQMYATKAHPMKNPPAKHNAKSSFILDTSRPTLDSLLALSLLARIRHTTLPRQKGVRPHRAKSDNIHTDTSRILHSFFLISLFIFVNNYIRVFGAVRGTSVP